MNYTNLTAYQNPSPAPFQQDDDDYAGDSTNHGIYLMWTLPEALRHGTQQADGTLDFPFVPNRWLVVRLFRPRGGAAVATPQAQSWVIESDTRGAADGTPYFDPNNSTLQGLLGHK